MIPIDTSHPLSIDTVRDPKAVVRPSKMESGNLQFRTARSVSIYVLRCVVIIHACGSQLLHTIQRLLINGPH